MDYILDNEYNELDVLVYLKKYDKFICKIANTVCKKCQRLEFEDVKQQLIYVLYLNHESYKKEQGTAPSTYYSQIILNAANNIIKKYWQTKNKINIECVSLDSKIMDGEDDTFIEFVKEESGSYFNPDSYFRINHFNEQLVGLIESFSLLEKQVFMLYMQGLTASQIATRLNKSSKTIYNAISTVKEKFKTIADF